VISGKITRRSNFAASSLSVMWHWHCAVNVSYPRLYPWLRNWTHLQWALHN